MLRFVLEKKLSVSERRDDVNRLVDGFSVSERRACRVLAQPRQTQRYAARRSDLSALRLQIRTLAYGAPRNGYRRIWDALRQSLPRLGLRRVYRLYRLEGLTMRLGAGEKSSPWLAERQRNYSH
ncbi:MAG: hypothetical protein EOO40_04095 [Deltaproteobacteria bacterium]|nr:MAG: hypothetical protein EOO40_04095 [Deltaproteobacteria bacterium]